MDDGLHVNLGATHAAGEESCEKESAKHVIRDFVNRYLRFDPVTNEDGSPHPRHGVHASVESGVYA